MKQFLPGDPIIKTVLGEKKVLPDKSYRWSDFVLPFSHNGDDYIFNTFTKGCYCISDDSLIVDPDVRYSSDDVLNSEVLTALHDGMFLVPENKDEATAYENFFRIVRPLRANMTKKGYKSFTILPTTACNARCFYCFEQGIKYVTMTDEIVEQTIRFILDNHRDGESVRLNWFGGEPLIGEKIIDRITGALRDAGVEFKSRFVSNGSLVTSEIIKKMKENWNVSSVQITLDGVEEEYNRRKNYYFNYDSAYWHVLSNIRMLNENDILLNIRVNIDEQNMGGLEQMLSEIEQFMPYPEKLTVDMVPLFETREREDGIVVWDKVFEMCDYIKNNTVFMVSTHAAAKSLRLYHCMADAPYQSVTIAPDGKLYNCENIDSFPSHGDIFNGVTDRKMLDSFIAVEKVAEKCRGCVCLPDCTPFTRCKTPKIHCKYFVRVYIERGLKELLDREDEVQEEPVQDC